MAMSFNDLSEKDKERVMDGARHFRMRYSTTVAQLLQIRGTGVAPRGIDLFTPAKWTPLNWKWWTQLEQKSKNL